MKSSKFRDEKDITEAYKWKSKRRNIKYSLTSNYITLYFYKC